jgi:sugar phosphate isomerase/epimerase
MLALMLRTLSPGAVHVRPDGLDAALAFARDYGFDGLEFDARGVAEMGAEAVRAKFEAAGVAPAVFGLPVEWRQDEARWRSDLEALPRLAKAAAELDCRRTATWVLPGSDERAMDANLAFHVERFRPIAEILGEHGISLGLEFIGPKTLRDRFAHPFVYTQDGMLELAGRIAPNVGLLLDGWHWYTSGGTVDDLRRLRPEQIVYVHINDAPAGVPVDEQLDNVRRLPGATGVIDMAGFFGALREIGYDGPVAVEPFDDSLAQLPDDAARLTAVRESMTKVGL